MTDDTPKEWDKYADFAGPLPDLLHRLEQRLEDYPQTAELAVSMVERRVKEGIDAQTMDLLGKGLDDLGLDKADALLAWGCREGGALVTQLESEGYGPRVTALLRRLIAEFGPQLDRAISSMGAAKDDWFRLRREVAWDLENQRYAILTEIEKYDGTILVIRGDQHSLLQFVRTLLASVRVIPDSSAFNADDLADFLEDLDELSSHLRSSSSEGDVNLGSSGVSISRQGGRDGGNDSSDPPVGP
jgi:hypothetical protein